MNACHIVDVTIDNSQWISMYVCMFGTSLFDFLLIVFFIIIIESVLKVYL